MCAALGRLARYSPFSFTFAVFLSPKPRKRASDNRDIVSVKGAEIEIVGLGVDGKADTLQKAAISDEISLFPVLGNE